MAAAQRPKASDKQSVCRKLVTLLKKRYKAKVPTDDRSVLETILYSICLENASVRQADAAFARLESQFFDLNESEQEALADTTSINFVDLALIDKHYLV